MKAIEQTIITVTQDDLKTLVWQYLENSKLTQPNCGIDFEWEQIGKETMILSH